MASVEKRDRNGKITWTVRWRDGAAQKRKTFEYERDAKAFRSKVETDKSTGSYVDPQAGKIKFAEYAQRWLDVQTFEDSTREATELRLRVHANPHLGHVQLQSLRPSTLQAWVRALQSELAPRTVRVVYSNVSAVLNAAVDDGLIAKNPCRAGSIRLPKLDTKRIEPWLPEELSAVVEGLPERFAVMAIIGAGLGLRQGEIFGLAVEDVDFLRGIVRVRRQVKISRNQLIFALPKNRKEREVPLPDSVAQALAAHLAQYPAIEVELPWEAVGGRSCSPRLILSTREAGALNRNYINAKVWKPALQAAGLDASRQNGMHMLRHLYASMLLDAGESIRSLAEYLGHEDPGFTLRVYTHLMPSSGQRTKKAVDQVLGRLGQAAAAEPSAPTVPRGASVGA
ncbi:MAG: phage integrase family protein [Frankiales bacterium]|nr:phage integrase family protein [Frankiales bacterium]